MCFPVQDFGPLGTPTNTCRPTVFTEALLLPSNPSILSNLKILFWKALLSERHLLEPPKEEKTKQLFVLHLSDLSKIPFIRVSFSCIGNEIIYFIPQMFFVLRKKHSQITFLHIFHHSFMPWTWWWGITLTPGRFHGCLQRGQPNSQGSCTGGYCNAVDACVFQTLNVFFKLFSHLKQMRRCKNLNWNIDGKLAIWNKRLYFIPL